MLWFFEVLWIWFSCWVFLVVLGWFCGGGFGVGFEVVFVGRFGGGLVVR